MYLIYHSRNSIGGRRRWVEGKEEKNPVQEKQIGQAKNLQKEEK